MCVEVVKSMAANPARSITGAIVRVLAVSTPSAAHKHWFPSRSEVSTSRTSAIACALHREGAALEESCYETRIESAGQKFGVGQRNLMERQNGVDARHSGTGGRLSL